MFGGMRFFHYISAGGLDPAFQAMLAKITPEEKRGSVFGVAASVRVFGVILASLAGFAIIGVTGQIRAVFICSAILFALLLPVLYMTQKVMKNYKPKE